MEAQTRTMDDRTRSIVSHLTPIGWMVAYYINAGEKGNNTSFYLRQTLGIHLFFILGGLIAMFHIPIATIIWYVLVLALWGISLKGAMEGSQKEVPVTGDMFQAWFKEYF